MKYDLIIKNGLTIDFETMEKTVKDIYILDGKFAEGDGNAESEFTVDAKEKYVLPGLIDEHTHLNLYGSNIGANADLLCIPNGVTTAVDAGTSGWTNFDGFYMNNIIRYTPSVYAYLHVSPYGVHSGCINEECHDPADFNEKKIIETFMKYPDTIIGLKIRMCAKTLGNYGIAPLKRCVEIADKINGMGRKCIIDLHYDSLPDNVTISAILDLLRKGDIFSHVFQIHNETIFTHDDKIQECVLKGREKGIIFDCCNGRVHWSFNSIEKALKNNFYPDIISSDCIRMSEYVRPAFSLTHAMTVASAAGMETDKILKCVTYNPAKALGILDKAGQIKVGMPADVCVMDIIKTDMVFDDWYGEKRPCNKVFSPVMTVKHGKVVYRHITF